jgi:hypothetical protein
MRREVWRVNYTVTVTLSNGKEIIFGSETLGKDLRPVEIKNKLTANIDNGGNWVYYENASGVGYFDKESITSIYIEK